VSDAPEPPGRSPELATDLVEYFVVVLPDRAALGGVVPAVTEMVRSRRIRVLDLVVLARGADGALDVVEVGEAGDLAALQELEGDTGLLSENDLRLAASAVRQGEVGLVLVAEDRWAEQLSLAARGVGGRIVAGERIPAPRVEAAVADAPDPDPRASNSWSDPGG
jgi:Family of unknown function (DUF6325)